MEHMCSLCPYVTRFQSDLISHLVKRHKHCSNFIVHCSAPGCGVTFKKHSSFLRHCHRKHFNLVCDENRVSIEPEADELVPQSGKSESCDDEAAFVLKLTAEHKLSQRAIQDVLQCTQELVHSKLTQAKKAMQNYLHADQLHFLNNECFEPKLFQGVNTEYKQEKYFEKHFQYIAPQPIVMGRIAQNRKVGGVHQLLETDASGYIVPFLSQLTAVLSMPEVQDCLRNPVRDSHQMTDYYDGLYFNQHKMLVNHPDCLCIGLYTDDFEVVNPIGSHRKKHKLTAFYWTLLNIAADLRSKLSVIQLLALSKTSYIKQYGSDKLLGDMCAGLQSLYTGCALDVPGYGKITYYGLLCFVSADTLAAQELGGFKEGVGHANKPCRTCDVDKAVMKHIHFDGDCKQRDEEEHRDRVQTLRTLSKKAHVHWSKKWGVNKESVLFTVPGFCLTRCILHDPMHVLLEGIARAEIKGLLNVCIRQKKYFTLRQLNDEISNFPYSADESRDKPQPFDAQSLDPKTVICQTAASMKTLLTVLPLMIGDKVPDDDPHWRNFIRLLQIVQLSLSAVTSFRTVQSLEQLIAAHNSAYCDLYPDCSFTPKMHYLVHFPEQLLQFGPLRIHWCMRYEAKNGFFKSKRWYNFKNIAMSLATHHQRWMCAQMLGPSGTRSTTYLYCGDQVTEGKSILARDEPDVASAFKLSHDALVLVSPKVTVAGHTYSPGTILIQSFDDEPHFVMIDKILVINHAKVFCCHRLKIVQFDNHRNMFVVEHTSMSVFLPPQELAYRWPQISHKRNGELFVMMCCVDDVWVL